MENKRLLRAGLVALSIVPLLIYHNTQFAPDELWESAILLDATFKAQLKTATQREQPFLFYYWTPESAHAAYETTPIKEPACYDDCEKHNRDAEDWLKTSKFDCASSDAMILVSYPKSLEEGNPPVAKFLSQMQLDPAVVNGQIK